MMALPCSSEIHECVKKLLRLEPSAHTTLAGDLTSLVDLSYCLTIESRVDFLARCL